MPIVYTTSPQKWAPAAANGVTVTPNGTTWVASAWAEIIASTPESWLLTGVSFVAAGDQQFVIEVGVGAAGSEVIIGSFPGHLGVGPSMAPSWLPAEIPIDLIPASSRVAVRLRKKSTNTSTWQIAIGYLPQPVAGHVVATATASEVSPAAGTDFLQTTSGGSVWGSGAWVQVVASSPNRWVLTGVALAIGSIGFDYREFELDVGVGGAGSEVVVTTVRFSGYWISNDSGYLSVIPCLDAIPAGSRVAVRSRCDRASAQIFCRLKYHTNPSGVGELVTARPQKYAPAAAVAPVTTDSVNLWGDNPWTEHLASTANPIALTGLYLRCPAVGLAEGTAIEIGTGAAGAETQRTLQRYGNIGNQPQGNHLWIPWVISLSDIPAGTRLSTRGRHGGSSSVDVGRAIGYIENPDFEQRHANAIHTALPGDTTNALSFTPATGWASTAWQELHAGRSEQYLLTHLAIYSNQIAEQGVEVDIGTGAGGAEVVATTFRFTAWAVIRKSINLSVPHLFPAGTRISARVRIQATSGGSPNVRVSVSGIGSDLTIGARVTQIAAMVVRSRAPQTPITPPAGGGTIPAGTNPPVGVDLCPVEVPIVYMDLTPPGGSQTRYSKVGIHQAATGRDDPRILSAGVITRALVDRTGGLRGSEISPVLADVDRALRALESTDSLVGAEVHTYLTSEAAIKAGGTGANAPRRVFQGSVTEAIPGASLTMQLICSDFLQAMIDREPALTFPQRTFTLTDFPNMGNDPNHPTSPGNPAMLGKAVPIGYGFLEDSASTVPTGVCPGIYTGRRFIAAAGKELDEYVFFGHAIKQFLSIWIPTGTPQAYPIRTAIPGTGAGPYYGPGGPLWVAQFGAANYIVVNGRTYTAIYAEGPGSELNRSGQVPLLANVAAIESVGDGTGTVIDSLARQILHLLTQFVLQNYQTGAWLSPPTIGSPAYSRIRTTSFEDVRTRSTQRLPSNGYLGAFVLGWDGGTHTIADLARMFHFHGLDLGVNKDGQIVASMVTPAAASVRQVIDLYDVVKKSFRYRRRRDQIKNIIDYRYARNYAPNDPQFTPPEGDPLPPPRVRAEFFSTQYLGPLDTRDTTSIGKYGERKLDLPLDLTRDAATAADLALLQKELLATGPKQIDYKEKLCGTNVDLGDKVLLSHFEGATATGYLNRELRCEKHTLDLDALTVATENLDLTGL